MKAADDLYILYPLSPLPELPLTVTEIGASQWADGRFLQRRRSTIMAVEWVTAGEMRLVQDGRVSRVRGGEIFILKHGSDHCYATVSGEARKRFVGLGGMMAREMLDHLPDRIAPAGTLTVSRCFNRLLALFRRQQDGWQLDAAAWGYRLCASLAQLAPAGDCQRRHPAVDKALRLIHSHGWNRVSVPWLAARTGTCPAHLTRLFRAALKVTPAAYARRHLVAQAKFLLENSTLPCKDIAARLGCDDPLYFSAMFKTETGESPMQFRNLQRGHGVHGG